MNSRLDSLQKDQMQETEKLKRECDALRDTFQGRLAKEYIPINKHEQLINEELAKASEKYSEQVRRLKEQVEKQILAKLEERDKHHQEAISKLEARH